MTMAPAPLGHLYFKEARRSGGLALFLCLSSQAHSSLPLILPYTVLAKDGEGGLPHGWLLHIPTKPTYIIYKDVFILCGGFLRLSGFKQNDWMPLWAPHTQLTVYLWKIVHCPHNVEISFCHPPCYHGTIFQSNLILWRGGHIIINKAVNHLRGLNHASNWSLGLICHIKLLPQTEPSSL